MLGRPLVFVALMLAAALAGCTSGTDDDDGAGADDDGGEALPATQQNATITWGDPATATIRPGASLGGYCTFNWLFTSATGEVYIGTAGHCTDQIGERVGVGDDGSDNKGVGTVVFDSDKTEGANDLVDFALVRLDPEQVAQAHPSMLGFDGPKGVLLANEASIGDLVGLHGHGMVVGDQEETRDRQGVLVSMDDQQYQADMPAVQGDSGSALIHVPTGKALGIISRFNLAAVPPTTDIGPTVVFIQAELEKAGFQVELATL